MSHEHAHSNGHAHESGDPASSTMGGHGMLVFGEDPLYFSHLPMFGPPHNFQVLLEVKLSESAREALARDRANGWDGYYTFDPVSFPIADLAPLDDSVPLSSIEGTLVRGHFEREGGEEIATSVSVDVSTVVYFSELDVTAERSDDDELVYLAFGRAPHIYLAHMISGRPSFDQVVVTRPVSDTVTNSAIQALDDDVATFEFPFAQEVRLDRADFAESRLTPGDRVTASFPMTISPGGAHGFHVDLDIEDELYIEIDELT